MPAQEKKMHRSYLLLIVLSVGLFPASGLGQVGSTDQQTQAADPITAENASQDLEAISAATTDKHALVLEGANWPGYSGALARYKINQILGTGVKWVMLSNEWVFSEPNAPTTTCQPSQGPNCYCGPKAVCHNYNFTALDQMVNGLYGTGIQVSVGRAEMDCYIRGSTTTPRRQSFTRDSRAS
jgi:hypothetical protein